MAASEVYLLDGGTLEMDGFHVYLEPGSGGTGEDPML